MDTWSLISCRCSKLLGFLYQDGPGPQVGILNSLGSCARLSNRSRAFYFCGVLLARPSYYDIAFLWWSKRWLLCIIIQLTFSWQDVLRACVLIDIDMYMSYRRLRTSLTRDTKCTDPRPCGPVVTAFLTLHRWINRCISSSSNNNNIY